LAARLSVCPALAAPPAAEGVEDVAGLDVVGAADWLAGVDVEELELLDEPPHPANAVRPRTSASAESRDADNSLV
jgi:hypothetical protein